MDCSKCNQSLEDSTYVQRGTIRYKSCPNCSQVLGQHAYYPEDSFGLRTLEDGKVIIQSWCRGCRPQKSIGKPHFLCDRIT